MLRNIVLIVIVLLFQIQDIRAATKIEIKEAPKWINTHQEFVKSEVSKYDVTDGVYFSLLDYQTNIEKEADYVRSVSHILTEAGLSSASQIYVQFDTLYERIEFHHLYIWRDGKKIDRTEDLKFELLSNESNLGNNIYSGLVAAHYIMEDLRKQDKIDYAYTVYGENPIFEDHTSRIYILEDYNPIDLLKIRILYPKNEHFDLDCRSCDGIEIEETTKGKNKEISIVRKNIEAFDFEETAPASYMQSSFLQLSNSKNWEGVVNWARGVFEIEEPASLNEFVVSRTQNMNTVEEKISSLIDFVQNDIRYMGIEAGIGGIKPFHPNEVMEQRFGDCKDKSLLLCHLLKEIGVTAHPAVVSSTLQDELDSYLPSVSLFDHVITQIVYNDNEYWIDPTISYQGGGFENRQMPNYVRALIINDGIDKIKPILNTEEYTSTHIQEELVISEFNKQSNFNISTQYFGLNADIMRGTFEYNSMKDIDDALKEQYSSLFPDIIRDGKIKIKDDIEENVLELQESYIIPNIWFEEDGYFGKNIAFQYEPIAVYQYIAPMSCESVELPVGISSPIRFSQSTTIQLPMRIFFKPENIDYEESGFRFIKKSNVNEDNLLTIEYEISSTEREIPAEKWVEMCLAINNFARALPVKIQFPKL